MRREEDGEVDAREVDARERDICEKRGKPGLVRLSLDVCRTEDYSATISYLNVPLISL